MSLPAPQCLDPPSRPFVIYTGSKVLVLTCFVLVLAAKVPIPKIRKERPLGAIASHIASQHRITRRQALRSSAPRWSPRCCQACRAQPGSSLCFD